MATFSISYIKIHCTINTGGLGGGGEGEEGGGGGGGGGLGLQEGKEEGPMSDLVECKWKQATLIPYYEPLGLVCVMSTLQLRYS